MKYWLIKLLGGALVEKTPVPESRKQKFTPIDYYELANMYNKCPAFFRYIRKEIIETEGRLAALGCEPENDRKALVLRTDLKRLVGIYSIPEESIEITKKMETVEKQNYANSLTNTGERDNG